MARATSAPTSRLKIVEASELTEPNAADRSLSTHFVAAVVLDEATRLSYGVRVDLPFSGTAKQLRAALIRKAEALRDGEIPQDRRGLVRSREDLVG
jgi:hypothetical protein